jgi:hypothetical protein
MDFDMTFVEILIFGKVEFEFGIQIHIIQNKNG